MVDEIPYEEKAARAARTQSLFREINERVQDINEAFSFAVPLGDWVCECADQSCTERIEVTLPEYDDLRSSPTRFAVAPSKDHVVPEVEEIVAKTDRFWVVEKIGAAGELAAKVDPRRRSAPYSSAQTA
jgi:hypothetical protein